MIRAIVLAAGASGRMGSPKALLSIDGKTFLQHLIDVLGAAGVAEVHVVVGADAGKVRQSLMGFDGRIVENNEWRNGQLSSIIAGLLTVPQEESGGILVCPVDHPLITPRLITDMMAAFKKVGKKIIIPVFQGRRGHPVLFSTSLVDEVKDAPPEIGLRQVIYNHPDDIYELTTDEEGIILNIDSITDYERNVVGRKRS